jgi:hypothetical protein
MFASFRRLGQRDLKRLAKELHAHLNAGVPTDLAGCQDLVARLHGHESWSAARGQAAPHRLTPAHLDILGNTLPNGLLHPSRPFRLTGEAQRRLRVVFGATGSGRTEALLSMFKGAVDQNKGGIFVDAQGSQSLYMKLAAYAHDAGRLQDVRVINLMTPGDIRNPATAWWGFDTLVRGSDRRLSHTFNPFETATLEDLEAWWIPLLVSHIETDNATLRREARHFLSDLFRALIEGRDQHRWPLDVQVIDRSFEDWSGLAYDPQLSLRSREALNTWRGRFVMWHTDHAVMAAIRGVVKILSETPAFRSAVEPPSAQGVWSASDLDWATAIERRELVLVLLPALEKAPPSTQALGEVMVHSLLHAVERLSTTPAADESLWVFDLAGLYATQALRGLARATRRHGITCVLGAYDFPSLLGPAPKGSPLRHQIVETLRDTKVLLFMRQYDLSFEELWPLDSEQLTAIRNQQPGETHVIVDGHITQILLAYHPISREATDALGKTVPLPEVPARWSYSLGGEPS